MPTQLTTSPKNSDGPQVRGFGQATATIDGRDLYVFSGCNYLGLAQHRQVIDAARESLDGFGLSTSASRTTTGQTAVHAALETEAAAFAGMAAALLLPDGYTANIAATQALAAVGVRRVLVDERAHPSLFDAARCAALDVIRYVHRSTADLRDKLGALPSDEPRAVLTDAVFTGDGSIAPIPDLLDAIPQDGWLVADDCHGFGVLGETGAGTREHFAVDDPRLLVTTTLAKAVGCGGGLVCGPSHLISQARERSTAYICTTPVPTPVAAGARSALRLIRETPALRTALTENLRAVDEILAGLGIATLQSREQGHQHSPIRAIPLPPEADCTVIASILRDQGILAPPTCYPGGPSDWYIRLAVSAVHTRPQRDRLASALARVFKARSRPRTS